MDFASGSEANRALNWSQEDRPCTLAAYVAGLMAVATVLVVAGRFFAGAALTVAAKDAAKIPINAGRNLIPPRNYLRPLIMQPRLINLC